LIKRLCLVALSLALLHGCAAPPPASGTAQPLPGVSPRMGSSAMCVGEEQPCSAQAHCCAGTSCVPLGRFGSVCRVPAAS
jgi:hypothetical protein